MTYVVKASYLEIYNERLRDLLAGGETRKLEISSHPGSGKVHIHGLSVCDVTNVADVHRLMQFGNDLRVKASTSMNPVSSRSHAIFTLEFLQSDANCTRRSKIHMVDLAGSERQNKAQVAGDRLREGCLINQSLSYLGLVIIGLTKGDSYVPFRNSKLTHFLIEGLSGNSKTAMIATISPSRMNYDETVSTLRFAMTCNSVKTRATVNTIQIDPVVLHLRQEVEALKRQLETAKDEIPAAIRTGVSEVPMLVRPNFFYCLSMTEATTVGSHADNDVILPPHCPEFACRIDVHDNNVVRCTAEDTFLRNGQQVGERGGQMFSLADDDLLEFGSGVAFRFQRGMSNRSRASAAVSNAVTGMYPPVSEEECAIACNVFESIHYSSDVDTLDLRSLYTLLAENADGTEGAEIVLVQSVLNKKRPELAVKHGFGLWTEDVFRELLENDHGDPITHAFRRGDLRAARNILDDQTRARTANTELEELLHAHKERVRGLETLHEEDSRAIDKLSNEFIELSHEVAKERDDWKKTQDELVKTSDAYAEECRQLRGRVSELEDHLQERDVSIKAHTDMIEKLKANEHNMDADLAQLMRERRELDAERAFSKKEKEVWDLKKREVENAEQQVQAARVDIERARIDMLAAQGDIERARTEMLTVQENIDCVREEVAAEKVEVNRERAELEKERPALQPNSVANVEGMQGREDSQWVVKQGEGHYIPEEANEWVANNGWSPKISGKQLSPKQAWALSLSPIKQMDGSSKNDNSYIDNGGDGETHTSSSSTARVDLDSPHGKGFGPRILSQSPRGSAQNDALMQDLVLLSDSDPGFVEALAGLMMQQIDEGCTKGLQLIIERIDVVAQSRNNSRVDSLDALLPLMAKGLRKFGQSDSLVRASFHCLARMCVRSAHNKWWIIEQALNGDFVEMFRGVMQNKKASVLGQACKFLSVVVLDGTQDGNLGCNATPYGNDNFLDMVITVVQKHAYASGETAAHTFGYACHALSAFLHAKTNEYLLGGSAWIVFMHRQGVANVLQGLQRYIKNRIAVFAVVQLLNAICVSGEDLGEFMQEPDAFPDLVLHAMRLHASHKGIQRICIQLLHYCLRSTRFDTNMVRSSPNLHAVLQNCQVRMAEENGRSSQGSRLLAYVCEQLKV
eukprot:GEMP01002239.1.p1 GENE.GEMP01002239.1~~GEMP01002239.1.p1  ORF type:complete len:1143 (+),score=255.50 GEMP01002239.1:341-3769(+)